MLLEALGEVGRRALFAVDPERAHELAIRGLAMNLLPSAPAPDPRLRRTLLGLSFPSPVGMAAGFDKNGLAAAQLARLGFGFVEIGTVTPLPQPGNSGARMWRQSAEGAIINRLGFPGDGFDAVHRNLASVRRRMPGAVLGVNIGANKDSPDRAADYASGIRRFAGLASYFALNVSSPNTPGLRDLQHAAALGDLLARAIAARNQAAPKTPVLVKIAPDLDEGELAGIAGTILAAGVDGAIFSNTTLARDGVRDRSFAAEAGGLSGRPLFRRSTVMLARLRKLSGPGFPLIEPTPAAPTNPDFVPNDFATGVVIDKAGYIVTTFHAIDGPGEIWVTTTAKRPLRAEIRGADRRSDLAVLRVNDPTGTVEFTPITFGDTAKLKKGQIVVALGNPYAIARDGRASASWGIIANLSRKSAPNQQAADPADRKTTLHHFGTLIQTDAKLNLGTSGGALLNLKGEMIGLTTSQAAVAGFEQAAGYAVPVDETFLRVIETLKQGKEVEYGLLGVSLRPLATTEQARGLSGVRVEGVLNGSPAERSGIFPGDLITQVSGQPIADVDGLMLLVGRQPAAARTTVTVERDGRPLQLPVTLAKFEVRGKNIVTAPEPSWRGIKVDFPSAHRELDPQFNLGLQLVDPAVLVVEVAPDSIGWQTGLRRGMLITHVGNTPVENPTEFYQQAAAQKEAVVELRIGAIPGQPPLVKVPAK